MEGRACLGHPDRIFHLREMERLHDRHSRGGRHPAGTQGFYLLDPVARRVPIVHTLIWMSALRLTGKPSDPVSTWKVIIGLYKHHLDLGHYHNDLTSPWYGWPILMHPIVIKMSTSGLRSRYSSSVG